MGGRPFAVPAPGGRAARLGGCSTTSPTRPPRRRRRWPRSGPRWRRRRCDGSSGRSRTGTRARRGDLAPAGDDRTAALLAAVVDNARTLRVRDLTLRYVDEEGAALAGRVVGGGRRRDLALRRVRRRARPGRGDDPVRRRRRPGGARRRRGWRPPRPAVAVGAGRRCGGRPAPSCWPPARRRRPTRYARRAAAAVPVVRRVLPGWRPRLVVEVPASAAALDRALAAEPGQYANIAAVTTTVDGSVDARRPGPRVREPRRLRPARAAGRAGGDEPRGRPRRHRRGDERPAAVAAGGLRRLRRPARRGPAAVHHRRARSSGRYAGRGRPPTSRVRAEFDTTTTQLGAAYESAWLACRLLARTGGERALVRLYRLVDGGRELSSSLRATFGLTLGGLTRAWRRSLSDLAA